MSVPAAFAGVTLIWSTTPLAIQWSSEGGGFLFGVTARMVLGLMFCLLVILISGVEMPWHARARGVYLAAGGGIYGSMLLVYWGAQFVPSGWVAVLFGLSSLSCCGPCFMLQVRSGCGGFRRICRHWRSLEADLVWRSRYFS